MPLVAVTTVYVYLDRRVTHELGSDKETAEFPAEIDLADS
jgi:hypothetical protein